MPYLGPIHISWEDQGQPRFAMTKCIDISETGLRIESPQPLRPGTTIQLRAPRVNLAGSATVKHLIRNGSKYLLGVQLSQATLGDTIAELEGRPVVTILMENLQKASL